MPLDLWCTIAQVGAPDLLAYLFLRAGRESDPILPPQTVRPFNPVQWINLQPFKPKAVGRLLSHSVAPRISFHPL